MFNHLTPTSDQDGISLYNTISISSRQIMRFEERKKEKISIMGL